MPAFLNSKAAIEEEEQARQMELVRTRAERDLVNARNLMLESLLKQYANRIVELEIRVAMLEQKDS